MEDRVEIIKKVTWIGVIVNLLLATLKIVFSIVGQSYALFSDAVHSLSDLITDFAILIGVRYWSRPADENHPHGHQRIEILVTGGIGFVLLLLALGIFSNAIQDLKRGVFLTPNLYALIGSISSIFVKEALYHYTKKNGEKIHSPAVIANAWHHRSDALSSIPASLAIIIAYFVPGYGFIDSVGAMVVAIFILIPSIKIMKPTLDKLVDRGASAQTIELIRAKGMETEGVLGIHDIKTRYITNSELSLELHVEVRGDLTVTQGHAIGKKVKKSLLEEKDFNLLQVLIHVDPHDGLTREK